MSQVSMLRELDANLAQQLREAGMADAATYTPPEGGDGIACTVLVDRNAQFFGDNGEVFGNKILISLQLAEVAAPARLATVAVGAETFALDRLESRDESLTRWFVVAA